MYEPTQESLCQHTVPDWFNDAKLEIFIHWGLYSIPGWAPTTGPLPEVIEREGWGGWFGRNPYAEWYMNSIRIAGSPSAQYHAATYGTDFSYEQFAQQFNEQTQTWDPGAWAELFAGAGARYVVLTTKHHDGFLLWPSATPNPFKANYHAERDLVGDLTAAVRQCGMRMGLYYSGGLDWTFNDHVIADIADLFRAVPQSAEYTAYADAHWRELIERYEPIVLWNDIGYPASANLPELFSAYYNRVAEGVINDRFTQADPSSGSAEGTPPVAPWFDFRTPEYAVFDEIMAEKWESCRGLGYSFGYNRNESPETMLSPVELIRSFVDIVSKNGNLLLNIGPMGDGTIPMEQQDRLRALGDWLRVNGDAIYGTRPWSRAEARTTDGTPLRFTKKGDTLSAVLLDTPLSSQVALEGLRVREGSNVRLLGHDQPLAWQQTEGGLLVPLPELPASPAHTLQITPQPESLA